MKKTVLSLAFVSIVASGVLLSVNDAKAVSFIESTQTELKRIMPGNDGILSYNDAIKAPQKSVVNIFTKKTLQARQGALNPFMNDPIFKQFFGNQFGGNMPQERAQSSLGSGVILTSDGYIVTNNHVIGGADQIMVVLPNEKKEIAAKVVGTDPKSDLAVIKIEANGLTPIKFTDSSKLKEGDVVFAIGNPFGIGETVTHGIISALGKSGVGINEYEDFIQTDAPINPGNSGGALVDSRGYFIGVNTAIISPTGQSGGIGFAIPSNMVKNIAKQLIENGKIERGFIGVTMQDMDEKARKSFGKDGVVVLSVGANTPAAKAGLKQGDVIVAMNGKKVEDSAAVKNSIGAMKPDEIVKFDVYRDGKILPISVKLEKQSLEQQKNKKADIASKNDVELTSGLFVSALTDEIRKQLGSKINSGVVVSKIDGGFGARSGLQIGDIITKIGIFELNSIADVAAIKAKYPNLAGKQIFILRRGMPMMIISE